MWLVGPVLAFPLSMPRDCWMWGRGVWRRTPVGWLLSHGHCSSHRGTWAGRGKTSTTHLELGNERPHSYRPHEEGPSSARGLGITGGACSSGWVEFRSSRAPSIQSLSVATVRGGGSGPVSGPGGGRREQAHLLLGLPAGTVGPLWVCALDWRPDNGPGEAATVCRDLGPGPLGRGTWRGKTTSSWLGVDARETTQGQNKTPSEFLASFLEGRGGDKGPGGCGIPQGWAQSQAAGSLVLWGCCPWPGLPEDSLPLEGRSRVQGSVTSWEPKATGSLGRRPHWVTVDHPAATSES